MKQRFVPTTDNNSRSTTISSSKNGNSNSNINSDDLVGTSPLVVHRTKMWNNITPTTWRGKLVILLLATTITFTFILYSIGHIVENDVKEKYDVQLQRMNDEIEELWMQTKGPKFCSSVLKKSQGRHLGSAGLSSSSSSVVAEIDITQYVPIIEPISMEVYSHNDFVSDAILKYGYWEMDKIYFFHKNILDYSNKSNVSIHDLTCVDIGSNIGWFTLSMASLGVQVMAFEPMTSNSDLIERSLCTAKNIKSGLTERVELFKNGLGTKEQTCFIVSNQMNEGNGNVKCVETESDIELGPDVTMRGKIVTKRLDDIVSSKGKMIVGVKMDVEGFESHVVEGGQDFLLHSKIPFIISEFVPENMERNGGDPIKMMNRLYDAGYKVKKDDEYLIREEAVIMEQYSIYEDVIFELVEGNDDAKEESRG